MFIMMSSSSSSSICIIIIVIMINITLRTECGTISESEPIHRYTDTCIGASRADTPLHR